jgi:hypothetical protein
MRIDAGRTAIWKRWCIVLWMLPYLFTSAFGEAMHSHPLAASFATSRVLPTSHEPAPFAGVAFSEKAHDDALSTSHAAHEHHACPTSHLHPWLRHCAAAECLACLWSAQTLAPSTSSTSQVFFTSSQAPIVAAPAAYASVLVHKQHSRGPPAG